MTGEWISRLVQITIRQPGEQGSIIRPPIAVADLRGGCCDLR
eukprot:CAMPEP_0196654586 /NCGR_PEP_ID=MMETSP1086-20130531/4317_1 /TAXON_ID=77921 /ORGANISM="Cyanoptyche  gloeocystis , Strain SAG4.97" /LENGTH=41 /DNA_ID= /DNA_START= /DNA_END= /DNA_ORIENTATION=